MRERRHLVILPVAALLAVLPLMLKGSSCGHDFAFHLNNWLEVNSQWKQSVLLPRWDFTAAWNSGEPRFVFYPPLSWASGAMLGLLLPWAAVPTTFLWIALTACGLTMFRMAREWTGDGNALVAACFYMVHPYMLFTMYERSADAELLAAAWLPLLFLGLLRARTTASGIAVPVALLWLTNVPAAVMGCYSLALLGVLRVLWIARRPSQGPRAALRDAATIAIGTFAGFGLAGIYLVPAIHQQPWVQIRMIMIEGVRVQDNFLFGHFGGQAHRSILRTASICSVTLLGLIALAAALAWMGGRKQFDEVERDARARVVAPLILLSGLIAFLLSSASGVLWKHLPELKYLQFPWRFDAILGVAAAALFALALQQLPLKLSQGIIVGAAVALTFSIAGEHFFRQFCHADVPAMVGNYYSGSQFDDNDEYAPVGSRMGSLDPASPSGWLAAEPWDPAPAAASRNYSVLLKERLHLRVSSPVTAFYVVHLRDYPAWQVKLNGSEVAERPHREDGLIVLPVPAGASSIDISYKHNWDGIAGCAISIATISVLLSAWWISRSSLERHAVRT